jgi:hypothetical protein
MKAPTRLPGALLITVGVMAAIYVGALVYAQSVGESPLPSQINTLVVVGFAAAFVSLLHWLITARSEERIAKRLAQAPPARAVVGTVPIHQIGVNRPRLVEPQWNSNDTTIVMEVRKPSQSRGRRRRTARPPAPPAGVNAEVIQIARSLSRKLDHTS